MPPSNTKNLYLRQKCSSVKDLHKNNKHKKSTPQLNNRNLPQRKTWSSRNNYQNIEVNKKKSLPVSGSNLNNYAPTLQIAQTHKNISNHLQKISPQFILHQMERNIDKLKHLYQKQNLNTILRKCASSMGTNRNSTSNNHKQVKNYESCRYSVNELGLSSCIKQDKQKIRNNQKKNKVAQVVPSVPRGSQFEDKKFIFEDYDKKMKKDIKTKDLKVKSKKNSTQKQNRQKQTKVATYRNSQQLNHKNIEELAQKLNLLATYNFYKGTILKNQQKDNKNKNPYKKSNSHQNKSHKLNKSSNSYKNSTLINKPHHEKYHKKVGAVHKNQPGDKTIRKQKNISTSNRNSSTKIYYNSSSVISKNDSMEQKKTQVKPKSKKIKTKTYKHQKNTKNNVQDNQNKHMIEELDFSSHLPQVQMSAFDKNMPIIEADDSRQEISSMMESSHKNMMKRDEKQIKNANGVDNMQDSLAGCQIAKISEEDCLDNYELVSISL